MNCQFLCGSTNTVVMLSGANHLTSYPWRTLVRSFATLRMTSLGGDS